MPSIVENERERRALEERKREEMRLLPRTVLRPDRTTFYCNIRSKRFSIEGVKILEHYVNGDCRVECPNGVTFTARAEEIFYIRKGDYHEGVDIS